MVGGEKPVGNQRRGEDRVAIPRRLREQRVRSRKPASQAFSIFQQTARNHGTLFVVHLSVESRPSRRTDVVVTRRRAASPPRVVVVRIFMFFKQPPFVVFSDHLFFFFFNYFFFPTIYNPTPMFRRSIKKRFFVILKTNLQKKNKMYIY